MERSNTRDIVVATTENREFCFEDFFNCSSNTISPVTELQRLDLSSKEWSGPNLCTMPPSKSDTDQSSRRGYHLGKRSSGSMATDCLQESSDGVDCDASYVRHPNKLALVKLLMKTLVHEANEIHDIDQFDLADLEILRSIVKRKYKVIIGHIDLDSKDKLLADLNSLDEEKKSEKRSEENNKLMFKRAIKYLIAWYKKNRWQEMKELRKKQYETMICKEFFADIPLPDSFMQKEEESQQNSKKDNKRGGAKAAQKKASSSKLNLTSGQNTAKHDELLRKFVINPNTINARYIKYVFLSKPFKDFFDDFVTNHFKADYRKNRGSKIVKIIDTVYSMFPTTPINLDDLQPIKEYIEKNPKFKLPWTDKELELCVDSTRQFILRVFRSKAARPFSSDRKNGF